MALELINRSWLEGGREDHVLNSLHLLREFRLVEAGARETLRADLNINNTDLDALRFVVDESATRKVTSRLLGNYLKLTSASVSALVERLISADYLTREVDRRDRRARILHATEAAQAMLESGLQRQVSALLSAASTFSAAELATVEKYLEALIGALAEFDPRPKRGMAD
ncbi:DNA-binding MarR family transcriptional regulator [Arthrobacter woluwensis]|uniref:MarR family winged helix-turn-helix transcriptional regulator n=1 Tax=Arthrobacter woluwensis TaxID=156980 RepID=UPI00278AAD56|nr:MarR family transcriptional regulator [Arthrobacter woluwensis]MDQ0710163.1 DNA-binding MarR family transcriptional regulator [Arthrobacter woluwensis]